MTSALLFGFTQTQSILTVEITSELAEVENQNDTQEKHKKIHTIKHFIALSWHVKDAYAHKNFNPKTQHSPLLKPPIYLL